MGQLGKGLVNIRNIQVMHELGFEPQIFLILKSISPVLPQCHQVSEWVNQPTWDMEELTFRKDVLWMMVP